MPSDDSQHQEHFPFLTQMEVLPQWEAAARLFLERGGTVMVLGAPDTGKSTLSRYLIYKTFAAGERVALVDLDLGQSHLGPPATLGLGLFPPRLPGDDSLAPEGLYFIGQTSPVGAVLEVVVGCRTLADLAARRGVTRVVVNTSGLVQGPAALRLKWAQAELLRPTLILALERDRELEPLVRALGGASPAGEPPFSSPGSLPPPESRPPATPCSTLRLPVSSRAVRKTPEERRRHREKRFRRYFQGAQRLALPWRGLVWEGLPWGQGETLGPPLLEDLARELGVPVLYGESQGRRALLLLAEPPPEPLRPPLPAGSGWEQVHGLAWAGLKLRLVGLLDASRRTLALGLILPAAWDPEALALWTPWPAAAAPLVRFLRVGQMRVSLEGRELPHV